VWLSKGLPPIRICVNVSLKQLENPTYFEQLNRILVESGLQPRHLELEITETLALKNVDSIQGVLAQLAGIGVKLTIDDFGTGYASYKHLSHLPIHALKIDKSFMRGINHNPDSEAIVASIIQLAKSLQLTVTAEGVETFEQLQFLKRNSCDEVQGFLYMQPEPANVFEPHLKRGFAHISQAFQ
jgi:EAL domain-containing protein (putative c-di-GMP-specific phosphodiesterase class I)